MDMNALTDKNKLRYELIQKRRTFNKLIQHADLKDEAQKLQREIITLENQLQ